MQNSKYLLFLSWDWEAWCLTQSGGVIPPPERNTAWNNGRKCFHCLGAPNKLIRPWFSSCSVRILRCAVGDFSDVSVTVRFWETSEHPSTAQFRKPWEGPTLVFCRISAKNNESSHNSTCTIIPCLWQWMCFGVTGV